MPIEIMTRRPETWEVIRLYRAAGLRRATHDPEMIARMITGASLVVSARSDGHLVGLARSITDFCHSCYLADLAVDPCFQKQGIGRSLVLRTKHEVGGTTQLFLLSAATAETFYTRFMELTPETCFQIARTYPAGPQAG
ncbi:GNAT family N-acetyltransferase [Singulisphaera acidiphila]|uniref:Acetyltransferase n=1 Tax=Singulisphaera acidiphila (strain ATCC BAA-1392 / DSM 18658 / VKM B-2454 / MOB10) TaxID=886293 RepID=L0DHC7_SINAD|nr:GNAT family N-acetyltransferase [Singulisphaera acidiphila]AGA28218.1 acetyltransferase [Singulisphaera acidiphila DSM 18658]